MAFDVLTSKETPRFTVVSEYTVYRIGEYPHCKAVFEECVYIMDGPTTVTAMEDTNGDGAFDTISFAEIADVTVTAGRLLATPESETIGRIASVTAADGVVRVTLEAPVTVDYTGRPIGVVRKMPVGTPAYRRALAGKRWEIVLDGSNGAAMARMANMLGTIAFMQVKHAVQALNLIVTDAQIVGALTALSAKGINIDGLFAAVGEQLELDRRAQAVGYFTVAGDAPTV